MDWLLVLSLEEGLVECATLCVESWVILKHIDITLKKNKVNMQANNRTFQRNFT